MGDEKNERHAHFEAWELLTALRGIILAASRDTGNPRFNCVKFEWCKNGWFRLVASNRHMIARWQSSDTEEREDVGFSMPLVGARRLIDEIVWMVKGRKETARVSIYPDSCLVKHSSGWFGFENTSAEFPYRRDYSPLLELSAETGPVARRVSMNHRYLRTIFDIFEQCFCETATDKDGAAVQLIMLTPTSPHEKIVFMAANVPKVRVTLMPMRE